MLRVSTQFHMPVTGHTLKGSIKPLPCIGSSRKDLLLLRPHKLRNALQHPTRVRFHSPDSLGRIRYAYSFLHRFVVNTVAPEVENVKRIF